MSSSKQFLNQTAETASFAFREFFRPLIATTRFLTSGFDLVESTKSSDQDRVSPVEAKAILHKRLATSRSRERLLLIQCLVASLANVLATAISLLHAFELPPTLPLLIILPVSIFVLIMAYRIVKNREDIIELKTLRRLVDSLEPETAQLVLRHAIWGTAKKDRSKPSKKVR